MGLGEEGMLASVLYSQGLGGGQGWRDTQWETVLRLVANLITPETLFRPLVITTTTTSNYFKIPPRPSLFLFHFSNSLALTSHRGRPGKLKLAGATVKLATQLDEVLHCPEETHGYGSALGSNNGCTSLGTVNVA